MPCLIIHNVEVWPYALSHYPQCKIQMLGHTVSLNALKRKLFARN